MYKEVARKIKFVRFKILDYTQDYMAQRLNISQNAYCKIENGQIQPTYERLKQIVAIFEMTLEELLNIDEKIVMSNCIKLTNAVQENTDFNYNNIVELKKVYEQLLEAQKEKYEMQIELLKFELNSTKK